MPKLGGNLADPIAVVLEGTKGLALIKSAEVIGSIVTEKIVDKAMTVVLPAVVKEIGVNSIKSGLTGSVVGTIVTGLAIPVIKETPGLLKRAASSTLGYDKGFLAGQKLAAGVANEASQKLLETVNSFIRDCSFEELFQVVLLLFSKNKGMSNLLLILRPLKLILTWGGLIAGFSGLTYYGYVSFDHFQKRQIVVTGANQLLDKCLDQGVVDFKEYKLMQVEIGSQSSIRSIQDIASDLYVRLYPNRQK